MHNNTDNWLMYTCNGSLYFVYIYVLFCACTFNVNTLDLCIFTGRYTYVPKIHISGNIYTYIALRALIWYNAFIWKMVLTLTEQLIQYYNLCMYWCTLRNCIRIDWIFKVVKDTDCLKTNLLVSDDESHEPLNENWINIHTRQHP